ncbi:pirin family protein [Sphingopyxis sp. 113P3]|jgi:Pirin-related protein|uniref:pirin family protein n=1 Tax=Sphingopyxis sp. (strain 113P3) TaxID=292913 RepID=UPI0006AD2B0D|nr:pirin family protein [Sphingopyxis sp. 113P3]ALC12964.1 pirin [Sphingopyxis sp. 113P3]
MIDIRKFETLGHANHGWLDARHHFSFANYHDESRMGWGALRVWNDDAIAAQSGFPPHPHRDMEIITYVRTGAITHRDSMGNSGRTAAGDVQVMSAGTGVTHSEFNLEDEETTLFQIWILPDQAGGNPGWGQRDFPKADRSGRFVTLASGIEGDDALPIRANARVAAATVNAGEKVAYDLGAGRHAYLVAAKGRIRVNGEDASPRDGIAIRDVGTITVEALDDAELVLVDSL